MNDTLAVKPLKTDQIGSTQLEASSLSFPRVVSPNSEFHRSNSAISSLSPTLLRVSHQPRSSKNDIQRSLCAINQTLTRVDTSSNPIGTTSFKVALQCDIPSDVTLAEFRAAAKILLGLLLETDASILTAIYNGEY